MTTKKRKLKPYVALKAPRHMHPKGWFAKLKALGNRVGKVCPVCKDKLKPSKTGRPVKLCKKPKCFKACRAAYRYDWEQQRLKKAS